MVEAYIGVDVGTASARAGVFDADGRLLAVARRPIAIWREAGDVVEQSSDDIWAAVTAATQEAVAASGLSTGNFAGMGFDATSSLAVVAADGRPLSVSPSDAAERNVIVWMDHRAAGEAARINAGGHDVLRYCGGKISPEMQPPKLAWLARRKPETFARAGHFFDLSDFLSWRATGVAERSLCTVACKFGYLAHEGRWPREFFDSIGLGAFASEGFARLGTDIVAPGAPLGSGLTAAAAAAMGLPPGLPVGAGLIDAHAGALGTLGARGRAGEADPSRRLALIIGTSACCMAIADAPRFLPSVWGPTFSALTPGQWLIEAGQSAFGAAIDHALRLHPAHAELTRRGGEPALEALERAIVGRAGSLSQAALIAKGLHVLPDFLGARAPLADAAARAAIVGLDLGEDETSLQGLYVATLCGLAYGVAEIVATLEGGGFAFDMLVVSGGASKSALVRQIIADVTGKIIAAPVSPEPVLLGGAMLGAVAAGRRTLRSAMSGMSAIAAETVPAGGSIAAFHAKKRGAFGLLRDAERAMRAAMAGAPATAADAASDWPELVIFDCDGVLVDSEILALKATRRALGEAGLPLSDEEMRERFLGLRLDSLLRKAEAELGSPLPEGFPGDLSRDILASFAAELKGIAGVRQAVAGLSARVCVASSSAPDRLRFALKVAGYEALFAPNIFSAAAVARGKPYPDLFLHAAAAMGARPEACLVIEDSVAGVEGARAAGMRVFGFAGGSHFSDATQAGGLTAAGAEMIFDDMARLPEIIAARRRSARAS